MGCAVHFYDFEHSKNYKLLLSSGNYGKKIAQKCASEEKLYNHIFI